MEVVWCTFNVSPSRIPHSCLSPNALRLLTPARLSRLKEAKAGCDSDKVRKYIQLIWSAHSHPDAEISPVSILLGSCTVSYSDSRASADVNELYAQLRQLSRRMMAQMMNNIHDLMQTNLLLDDVGHFVDALASHKQMRLIHCVRCVVHSSRSALFCVGLALMWNAALVNKSVHFSQFSHRMQNHKWPQKIHEKWQIDV